MKKVEYVKCNNFYYLSLNGLYSNDYDSLKNLDLNILRIIEMESPISLNMLKARLREAMNVKKISQKALDIINDRLDFYKIVRTNNLFEEILWPKEGVFEIDYIRVGGDMQIYDIAYQELTVLTKELISKGYSKERLYREVLAFYNYEVLTEKAFKFLEFIESKSI